MEVNPYQSPRETCDAAREPGVSASGFGVLLLKILARCALMYVMAFGGLVMAKEAGNPFATAAGGLFGLAVSAALLFVMDGRDKP